MYRGCCYITVLSVFRYRPLFKQHIVPLHISSVLADSSAKQASLLKRMSDVTALSEDDADHSPHISEPDTELEQLHKQNQHLLHLFKQADVDNQRYKEVQFKVFNVDCFL